MESVDTEYYNSLQWIRENDPTELELAFQVTILQELELAGNFPARAGAGVTCNYIYHGVFSVGKKEKN